MKYNTTSYNGIRNVYQKIFYGLYKRHFYYITSPLRVLPDFFVIGVVRSGTTSLYHYLGQHPSIKRASYDELGYFDDNYHLGRNWYKSLFPTQYTKQKIQKKYGKFLTYDVTPFYIYNPLVVKRIFEDFPNAKIIANLRNPIDRAYSNYTIAFQDGDITSTFEEVIQSEIDEIEKSKSKLNDKSFLVDIFYEKILARGFYVDQLKIWYDTFPKDQLLMISSEDFGKQTDNVLKEIFEFLDVPYVKIKDFKKQNERKYLPMKNETRKLLVDYFKPHNKELFEFLGKKFEWDK